MPRIADIEALPSGADFDEHAFKAPQKAEIGTEHKLRLTCYLFDLIAPNPEWSNVDPNLFHECGNHVLS